jgi:hypothetical protein
MYFSEKVATFRINLLKAVFSEEKFAVRTEVLFITPNTYCLYSTLNSITLKHAAISKPIFKQNGKHSFDTSVLVSVRFGWFLFSTTRFVRCHSHTCDLILFLSPILVPFL